MAGAPLLPALFARQLESALDEALRLDPAAREALVPLSGKMIGLCVTPFGLRLSLRFSDSTVHLLQGEEPGAEAVVSGSPLAFARSAQNDGSKALLFSGELKVEGDADLARRFQELLKRIRLNWESRWRDNPGGAVAFRLAGTLARGHAWLDALMDANLQDLSEYVREETRELPGKAEADGFLRDVDGLRGDCDRLEARIARLEAEAGTSARP